MNDSVLVRCEHVTRVYASGRSEVTAVRDVSCAVSSGQRIGVVGPSGSGKSTLLHLVAGLEEPTSGTVTWPALGGQALRPGPVAFVFQSPSLLAPLDVTENVALPLLLAGTRPEIAGVEARRALAALDLDAVAQKLPEEISGGQAQRAAVARALTGSPRLIVADEPTGQLDHVTAAVVLDSLLAAAAMVDAAVVVATHDPAVAGRFELTWEMLDGRLIETESSSCSP